MIFNWSIKITPVGSLREKKPSDYSRVKNTCALKYNMYNLNDVYSNTI